MKNRFIPQLLILLFLTAGFLGWIVTPVSAGASTSAKNRIQTFIIFDELSPIDLGEPFVLSGMIKDGNGRPVVGKSILFTLEGDYLGQARSDEEGYFVREFRKELDAGTYEITASSTMTTILSATSSVTSLNVLPAEVQVRTIPPISGVTFNLAGKNFLTGKDGVATIQVSNIGDYQLRVLPEKYSTPDQRIEFGRWLEESYDPSRMIHIPDELDIQVGLNVFHRVGQTFVDMDGNPIDMGRVSTFTIRSIQGDVFEFADGQSRWIPSSRTARRITGLEETQLLYSVIEVMVNGSNVVNQSQQRFFAQPGDTWTISLLFYSLHVDARDGLFGNTVGQSVNLTFPDGSVKNFPLDDNGAAYIESLPRGNYTIEFVGIKGMSNNTPVALSRDQIVHTKVITYLDIAVVGLFGVTLALGLLFYGRPWLINNRLIRRQPVIREAPPVLGTVENYHINTRYKGSGSLEGNTFQLVTGVSQGEFMKMLAYLKKRWGDRGKNTKLSLEDQLLLTLIASKGEQTKVQIGQAFGVSETTVRRTIRKVNAALDLRSKDPNLVIGAFSEDAEQNINEVLTENRAQRWNHFAEVTHDK